MTTRPSDGDVVAFIDGIPDETRRRDAVAVKALMERVTGVDAGVLEQLIRNAWQAA